MLKISDGVVAALETDASTRRRLHFPEWLRSAGGRLGGVRDDQALAVYDKAVPEAMRAGIDTDERLYVFTAARGLMPGMTGIQYMLVLDVVFAPIPQTEQLAAIMAIKDRSGG